MSETKHHRLVTILGFVVIGMFGFGFALVPLYSVICDTFGLNGRFVDIAAGNYDAKAEAEKALSAGIDKNRTVTVQFVASRNQGIPWEFKPLQSKVTVHPGEVKEIRYFAKNLTGKPVVAQAVPSLSPGTAVKYFTKIECFCFTKQTFKAGEQREMPLRFVVDPKLPKNINTVTIAYTFFDTKEEPQQQSAQAITTSLN